MGIGEGTETTEKGDLIVGEIAMGRGPISLVPVDVKIVHIHGSLVNAKAIHIHRSPVDAGTIHIHGSPANVGTVHIHGIMQIGVQIPQKSNGFIMPPWML